MKNNILLALRRLLNDKIFSIVNILGLATGMAASLLIIYYVNYEKSYDRFNSKYDEIYRLELERTSESGESVRFASCCPPIGLRIREKIPEVNNLARLLRYKGTISYKNNMFSEDRLYFAEPEFMNLFDFSMVTGDPGQLGEQGKVILSESTAVKYFGDEDPLGKNIELDREHVFSVAGIFKDAPYNSHLKPELILSWPDIRTIYGPEFEDAWGHTGVFTYITFSGNQDIEDFNTKIDNIIEEEFGDALRYYKLSMELPLNALKDIHLASHSLQEHESNSDRTRINFLFIVSVFLIIIAWVNYIVLSTSQSASRSAEIGLRKINGADRKQIIKQLFVETTLIYTAAVLAALILSIVASGLFISITGLPAGGSIYKEPVVLLSFAMMYMGGIILAGIYPILLLSGIKTSYALKGKQSSSKRNFRIRQVLVIIQNFISLVILSGTIAVFMQQTFLRRKETGLDIRNTISVKAPRIRPGSYNSVLDSFFEVMQKKPGIEMCSSVSEVPGRQIYWDAGGIFRVGSEQSKNYLIIATDYNYTDLFNINFLAGRSFSREFSTDSTALILNEKACSWMGFESPDDAIGKQVNYWGIIYEVIGVTEDFHQQLPKYETQPTIIRFLPEGMRSRGNLVFRTSTETNEIMIGDIRDEFNKFFPGNPFEYFFVQEYYEEQLQSETTLGRIFILFAIITIIITLLGIIGLTSFMVNQSKKDISIRKVFGEEPLGILVLYSKRFIILILISFILSVPLSWYLISEWLKSYANHIEMNILIFIIPLLLTTAYTIITVILLTYKESVKNPINNLRYE